MRTSSIVALVVTVFLVCAACFSRETPSISMVVLRASPRAEVSLVFCNLSSVPVRVPSRLCTYAVDTGCVQQEGVVHIDTVIRGYSDYVNQFLVKDSTSYLETLLQPGRCCALSIDSSVVQKSARGIVVYSGTHKQYLEINTFTVVTDPYFVREHAR